MSKKKKVIVHQFDPVIYPRQLWVCFNATREALEEHLEFEGPLTDEWFTDRGATTSRCVCKKTGFGGLVVWTGLAKISTNYITHEATHVADVIFEYIGEDTKTTECYAYLAGWVAECIEIAMNHKQ